MDKCWERYGKKWLKPEIIARNLTLFMRTQKSDKLLDVEEHIWVLIPLITVSQYEGLPILMEASHRDGKHKENKPYYPIVQPGQALMFDARLRTHDPNAGGGVVFAMVYDVTGM